MSDRFSRRTRLICRSVAVLTTLFGCFVQVATAAEKVELVKKELSVAVTVDGQDFTIFHIDPKWKKPFFSPVRTASGTTLTRGLEGPDSKDHPHHKGIWLAIDEVNGGKFWAEQAVIKNVSVELVTPMGNPAQMHVVNHWIGADGEPTVIEETDIRIYANRLLAYDIKFTAGKKDVHWGDTKEGLFGIRVADTVREKQGGQVVNADGLKTTKECWGKPSAWVDYVGPVDGKLEGVAIFDHPDNFRRSRYHVRDYGLFTISPFGQKSYTNGSLPADELTQKAGSSYRLRYGLYVHPGTTQEGKVAETFVEYVKSSK